MDGPDESAALRIGSWVVHASEGFIEQAGERRPLRFKSMEVLLLLASRPGSTIPRDEFLRALWKDEFVEEANLTRCIAEIRAALGDDARSPRYVVNVPRRGYRLVAKVRSQLPARARHLRYQKWAAALFVAVTLGAVALLSSGQAGTAPPTSDGPISDRSTRARVRVALLPIANLGEDPAYDWVPARVERMLAAEIAAGSESSAVPADSVLHHAAELAISSSEINQPAALQRLTSAVGASHWLWGSFLPVEQDGLTKLRFDLLLLDAKTGLAVHGVVLTTPVEDLSKEVGRVARELRRALELPPSPGGPSPGGHDGPGRQVAFMRAG